MRLPLEHARRSTAQRDDHAGCLTCRGQQAQWTSRNAQALAAKHHDRTGHVTWYSIGVVGTYGAPAVDQRQIDIEDAIAASSSGGEPEAAPLPVPDAPAVAPADVSASSAAHRDMPFNGRGARGRKPETAHV